jgi:hypothetical protein
MLLMWVMLLMHARACPLGPPREVHAARFKHRRSLEADKEACEECSPKLKPLLN